MDEEILERGDGGVRRLLRRIRPPGPARGLVAVALLAVVMSDLAVLGSRSGVAPVPPPDRSSSPVTAAPSPGTLDGPGPYALYAVEKNGAERIRVFAVDASVSPSGTMLPSLFLGEFPGFVTDFAGRQGQAGGVVVPVATAEETTDASRATRLWLLRRNATLRPLLTTFDFVSAFALNASADALAISRRSVLSPARGAFLWLHPIDPKDARQVGSLRRPGGSGPASQLRPVAWSAKGGVIYATPYCDQCADDGLDGMYAVSLSNGSVARVDAVGRRSVRSPSFSSDGTRLVFEEVVRFAGCHATDRCEEHRLVAVDFANGGLREFARSRELSFSNPVLSPDGSLVAYATGRGREVAWRSFESGAVLGAIEVSPSEEVEPVAWIDDRRLLVTGRTSSARPEGPSEGNLFLVTRALLDATRDFGAHIDLLASAPTLIFLGWLR